MSVVRTRPILLLFVCGMLLPGPASADLFVVPWVGGNAGGPNGAGLVDFGGSLGTTAASVVDIDFDLGYSPDYFGNRAKSYVLTTMGNVTLGIPFGRRGALRFRPYLTGGVGLIRSRFESVPTAYRIAHDDLGVAFGGGLTVYAADHIGVRADLRHLQSLQDPMATEPLGQFDFGRLHYWRASIGLVIR